MKQYILKDHFVYDEQNKKVNDCGWLVKIVFLNEKTKQLIVPENYNEFCELEKEKGSKDAHSN